ncbi:MAG: hypothetical protein WBF42_17765 [Terracidiphilus sp.]
MRPGITVFAGLLLIPASRVALPQSPGDLVSQVVRTELAADNADHSHWLYYDVDGKPTGTVRQWVAETGDGSIHRILFSNGQITTTATQHNSMDTFIHDSQAQEKQRKSGQADDKQSAELLRLLPNAFNWTIVSRDNSTTLLHFAPDDAFKPPTWASRVFAAMAGDMRVDNAQHRIVSLRGQLTREVKFCGGLCGAIHSGGTFNVERRQIGPSIWQITETHVHINGTILFFKSISEQEDDVKTRFHQIPTDTTLEQAESMLMQQNSDPSQAPTVHASTLPHHTAPGF